MSMCAFALAVSVNAAPQKVATLNMKRSRKYVVGQQHAGMDAHA